MNNPRSMALGWATLIVGAGVSFYYAKKEINARRQDQAASGKRSTVQHEWYDRIKEDQASVPRPPSGEGGEVVAPSHVPHSTGNTKRPNTAA